MLRIAARGLWRRKSRSLLAILAIVVGILAILLLISLTAGLKASYSDLMGGINGIYVMEKGAQDQTLSKVEVKYADEIEKLPGVRVAIPEVWVMVNEIEGERPRLTSGSMTFGMVIALGLDPQREQRRIGNPYGVELLRGRSIKPGDGAVAVIGEQISKDYKRNVGSRIEINGKKFQVIGIFSKNDLTDAVIAMPIGEARGLSGLGDEYAQDFLVQLTDPQNEDKIAQTIKFKWPDKFDTYTSSDMNEMIEEITAIIDQFFWIISAIALAIAGIGIVNTMLIAVKERIGEFGTLRATGWTQEDVLRLVITESVLLGLSGGFIGVALGYIITAWLATVLPFPPVITPELAIIAFVFAGTAGLIGGAYPAWKASRLDPILAMRGDST